LENATVRRMYRALYEFGDMLKTGGGVGLFFYAGHGIQVKGQNYLVPLEAQLNGEASARFETLPVEAVTELINDAGNRINLIILAVCRTTPFERRLRGIGSRGLAAIDAARGTLIAYSTSPGAAAADGDGANGTYTEALLRALDVPDLQVEEVFKRVRAEVV